MKHAADVFAKDGNIDAAIVGTPYHDIAAALDYYRRMVAAYAIGYSVTKDDLEAYPHLKFATGESDTGVIISWNTEGKQNVEENAKNVVVLPNAISINPLNWKLDETYAPASLNLGSYKCNKETGEPEFVDLGADAQIIKRINNKKRMGQFDVAHPHCFLRNNSVYQTMSESKAGTCCGSVFFGRVE